MQRYVALNRMMRIDIHPPECCCAAGLHIFASICMTGICYCFISLGCYVNILKIPQSAPSGSYGTMVYIAKAVASVLDCLPQHGDMDCTIS